MPAALRPTPLRSIISLILFGAAFGYLEAAVVVYLRELHGPVRAAFGLPAQTLFPLMRPDQLPAGTLALLKIELGREAATLIMLATVASAIAKTPGKWLAAFFLAFGVWDLTFYLWLRVLIGWPPSILTWDILFLLPVPWAAPVLAPFLVAATMAVFGAWYLFREAPRSPKFMAALIAAGGAALFVSFIWDWQRWLAGGVPQHFPWPLFGLGEALVIAGCAAPRFGAIAAETQASGTGSSAETAVAD